MGLPHWTLAAVFAAATAPTPHASPGKIARIRIHKTSHTMDVVDKDGALDRYPVSLGPGGAGFKRREGDRVTPVGHYHVLARAPSKFKIFMRLDYPNDDDRKRFAHSKSTGELPAEATIGGDIGIHGGTPDGFNHDPDVPLAQRDWTLGCIGVEDDEIVSIARRTPNGTPVDIDDD